MKIMEMVFSHFSSETFKLFSLLIFLYLGTMRKRQGGRQEELEKVQELEKLQELDVCFKLSSTFTVQSTKKHNTTKKLKILV